MYHPTCHHELEHSSKAIVSVRITKCTVDTVGKGKNNPETQRYSLLILSLILNLIRLPWLLTGLLALTHRNTSCHTEWRSTATWPKVFFMPGAVPVETYLTVFD